MLRKVPLIFSPQPEGGYTVTSPIIPELITEGDTLDEAYANVSDALAAVLELYAEQGRTLPESTKNRRRRRSDLVRIAGGGRVRYRDVARKLTALGCHELSRTGGGSHRKWFNPTTARGSIVPDWGSKDLKLGTLRAIIRQLGIEWDVFLAA